VLISPSDNNHKKYNIMKRRILNIFNMVMMSGVLLLLTPRCVDLDETPLDFTGPDNFYQSVGQIESAFASSMNRLYQSWSAYSYTYYNFWNDDQYKDGDLVIGDNHGSDIWSAHYESIADINPAIQALNEDKLGTSATQEVKDQLMAQAKFIRAWNYFFLVRLWGDVPLILETTEVVTGEITRAPTTDVYAQIESDLLYAIANLPDTWPAEKHGRMAKDAAKALLAKAYLTMATAPLNNTSYYVKARDMAADVMDDGIYHLVPNIDEVFALTNAYGPEIMWSYNASEDDESTPPQIYLPGSMADGWGDTGAETKWTEDYPEQPRKHAYLLLEDWDGNDYHTFWWNGAGIKKFLMDTRDNMERYRSVQNYPLIRYADVLLIFAEAENMVNNGPDQAAVDAINQTIDRANNYVDNPAYARLTTSMSRDDFDEAVIQERNLELCFEYDRWFDLIRKRILCEKTNPIYVQNCDDCDYLFPLPLSDLRLNPLLTQNPCYASSVGGK
jgi:hypothetical protein